MLCLGKVALCYKTLFCALASDMMSQDRCRHPTLHLISCYFVAVVVVVVVVVVVIVVVMLELWSQA